MPLPIFSSACLDESRSDRVCFTTRARSAITFSVLARPTLGVLRLHASFRIMDDVRAREMIFAVICSAETGVRIHAHRLLIRRAQTRIARASGTM